MWPSSRTSSRCKRRKEERSSNVSKSSRRSQAVLRSVMKRSWAITDFLLPISDLQSAATPMEPKIGNRQSAIGNALVECVPNFSEGRKLETVERLMQAIQSVDGAVMLDMHMDADHNRSVITFAAEPGVVVEAALRAVALAAELIDLRRHSGQHPRLGATDVLPFVPVRGVTMDECVALAHQAGDRIWRELSIPVYFYERAALRPDRVRLEHVRGKGFEALREEIAMDLARSPDIGERRVHETAGAIAIS